MVIADWTGIKSLITRGLISKHILAFITVNEPPASAPRHPLPQGEHKPPKQSATLSPQLGFMMLMVAKCPVQTRLPESPVLLSTPTNFCKKLERQRSRLCQRHCHPGGPSFPALKD